MLKYTHPSVNYQLSKSRSGGGGLVGQTTSHPPDSIPHPVSDVYVGFRVYHSFWSCEINSSHITKHESYTDWTSFRRHLYKTMVARLKRSCSTVLQYTCWTVGGRSLKIIIFCAAAPRLLFLLQQRPQINSLGELAVSHTWPADCEKVLVQQDD